MSFAVAGTVPDNKFPLLAGEIRLEDDHIRIQNRTIPVNRGTPALLAAAARTCEVLDQPPPIAFLVGDIGLGDGSRQLYAHLEKNLNRFDFSAVVFHYLQPDVDWHNRVLFALQAMHNRPKLIADAGYMYAAKMSGEAEAYDLFTPDVGELAFLADEEAPHPFYTRGFILHDENRVPELIRRACEHHNAARYLLVKGKKDYITRGPDILETVADWGTKAMEAMGGTGDTLTGMVSALAASGVDMAGACRAAAEANRFAGQAARPTPATQVIEIIRRIPQALKIVLR